jgi:hypothetical protein
MEAELPEVRPVGRTETHRTGGSIASLPGEPCRCTGECCVIVGVNKGEITIKGNAVLTGGLIYHHVKLVIRAAEAAARWRERQAR